MYRFIAIAGTIIVAAACILNEITKKKNPGGKLNSESKFGKWLIDWTEKPMVAPGIMLIMFIVFLASRLFHLQVAPTGIHCDEIGMAYDAMCLANSGCDRWGHAYPVYLQNYAAGQSSLYAYTFALLLKFFPFSFKLMRIPAVIYASGAFFCNYLSGKIITGKKLGGILGAGLVIITPYFLMSERWGLDCNLFLSLASMALAFTLVAINNTKIRWYVLAGLFWGITLYTYIVSYVIIPVFIVLVMIFITLRLRENAKRSGDNKADAKTMFKYFGALVIPIVLLGTPLMLEQMVNLGIIGEFSFLGSDYFVFMPERAGEFSFGNIIDNLFILSRQLFTDDELTYNALPGFGALLMPMIPLFYYGLYTILKRVVTAIKHKSISERMTEIVLLSLFVVGFCEMMVIYKPNFNRYNELFLPILLFMMVGLWELLSGKLMSFASGVASLAAVFVCFAFFAKFYYCDMNDVYGKHLLFETTEVADAVMASEKYFDPAKDKTYYIEIEYDMLSSQDLMIACAGNVSQKDWLEYAKGNTGDRMGRFNLHFTDNFDENENAIYILGNSWSHISEYICSVGFVWDKTFGNYAILYK